MSEHWKSTPRYWCKHCACYVRDTKLERQNHEATARHQGALKRFLRDLHRGHEKEERDKERARQEIERVSGVVSGSKPGGSSSSGPSTTTTTTKASSSSGSSSDALKKQREQLAELGVAMPSELRPEMAIAGEWQVTSTRVIRDDADEETKAAGKATGVRKRETTEEQREEENAVQGLFKKPRRWGRDSKAMPAEEDAELDALLSGSVLGKAKNEEVKTEVKPEVKDEEVKTEEDNVVKKEEEEDDAAAADSATSLKTEAAAVPVKTEAGDDTADAASSAPASAEAPAAPAPVMFKKRKAKGTIRQK